MKKHYFLIILFSISQTYSQCWQSISTGYNFTISVNFDGTLWGTGNNEYGQLGDGTFANKNVFTQIGTDNDWKTVSAGPFHSFALKTDGTLWAWGFNDVGQLGIGNDFTQSIPIQVGTDNDWASVFARADGGSAIKTYGTLWSWGANDFAQLGDSTLTNSDIPIQIRFDNDWKFISGNGFGFTVGLKTDGSIWGWGSNLQSQLGLFSVSIAYEPTEIGTNIFPNNGWKAITTSSYSCLAIKTNDRLYGCGGNDNGELGNGQTTEAQQMVSINGPIGGLNTWLSVESRYFHTLGIKTDGTLWSWGNNTFGSLGDGTTTDKTRPVLIGNTTDYETVIPGGNHSFTLKTDGSLLAFGYSGFGELGIGDEFQALLPTTIACPSLTTTNFEMLSNQITIYPNPANHIIHVRNKKNASIDKITVIDLTGKVVLQKDGDKDINIQSLEKGVYIMQVLSESNTSQKKFIKY